jgi:branched-chain amino acid transport system ATP-binding protein
MALPTPTLGKGGSPPEPGALMVIEDVSVSYGRIRAVDGVSLTVPTSGCTAILGPNGAGKTTLLRGVTGLARAQQGRITFEGQDITHLRPSRIARLGIAHVQQGRGIFPRLTVNDNLRAVQARLDDPDLDVVFNHFPRLEERRGQVAGTLSGGEQQMLALGLALMGRPRLLLVDEPSLGLAPQVVREIYAVFGRLRDEGTSLVIVEQFVHMLLGLADRVHLLQKGKITSLGTPEELFKGQDTSELMGMYVGAEQGPQPPAIAAIEVAESEPEDRIGRSLQLMRRLEDRARSIGEPVDALVARTLGVADTDRVGFEEGTGAEEISGYQMEGSWATCDACRHRFRPILISRSRCPRCRAAFAEHDLELPVGPLARWWSERLRNPSFVLLVVVVLAFSQLVLLAALLRVGD